ncbi:FAD-dependent monooxygenase fsr3 [Diaporthe amygdali]|uniref:FAD-dependent monooxygenase fsr3 n=1 Tax=Phomopsis amygdali TaxID=1214568 RepID=UPI0022FE3BEB|nr:FAD-dependent monooxygenase fsr3 [Diaporthe amygdali]KAJ0115630.1 FAD-dependent monooxygenase fsr3 [Diaporthe amygdali]
MERLPDSGLSVLVVGAGIAGLAFSIEAYRQGHTVKVLEKRAAPGDYGEIFFIQSPGLHTPSKWPGFMDRLKKVAISAEFQFFKFSGQKLFGTKLGSQDVPTVSVSRREFYELLLNYATEFGGVVLSDGRRLTSDVVVAADGVGSRSGSLVTGTKEKPISSGFALYRTSYPTQKALETPALAEFLQGKTEWTSLHIGPGAHFFIGLSPTEFSWGLTHRDEDYAVEDWNRVVDSRGALRYVQGWAPIVHEVIKSTPNSEATDWKLRFRDPQPKWVSDGGRVVQCGDSAHSFLPSSGFGATTALEDAFSLAACLKMGGKESAPIATKVHNHLRFERTACAQKIGFKSREAFHRTNWDEAATNPRSIAKFTGAWLLKHDPELYAYENYEACAAHLLHRKEFKNTNTVPGFPFKLWTVQELLDKSDRGESIDDDEGDCDRVSDVHDDPTQIIDSGHRT